MAKRIMPNDNPMRAIRPMLSRYDALFPSCIDCDDLADGRDGRCSKCASDREWEARRASMRREG